MYLICIQENSCFKVFLLCGSFIVRDVNSYNMLQREITVSVGQFLFHQAISYCLKRSVN